MPRRPRAADLRGPSRLIGASTLALLSAVVAVGPALAQATVIPPSSRDVAASPATPAPAAPAQASGALSLSAAFSGDGKPIRSGLVWRVFGAAGNGDPQMVAKTSAAAPNVSLPVGSYLVHVSYGFASATKPVTVGLGSTAERIALGAGALRLGGSIGDMPIPANRMAFNIYLPVGNDSEGRLVAGSIKGGDVIGLPEGSYHIVSTYGESNAVMRVDLRVDAGKLTEATVNHRAATVTLKLVAAAGGEAFAGTAFSVLTPGGDVIREAIGAFPTMTLAEGDYVAIARHDGSVYTRDFKVESGLDRDIEVLATTP